MKTLIEKGTNLLMMILVLLATLSPINQPWAWCNQLVFYPALIVGLTVVLLSFFVRLSPFQRIERAGAVVILSFLLIVKFVIHF